ncbi:type IV toxin-antitoxin system AbiEi family antitoxin domain-containing protein [Lacticaseibacillus chiayiensis]|uniref:type IV toxin-antitoxin system AbiEi family antitoxin domain-containing protein n=1 Tax=Lacticaseibacillus chiayiensis TaxID=2100821 RepID=UPI001010D9E7|nr:type IV toxin-antitoxin system AbiEi family antitoxin domain-containing protein [Lacticaseibacillus chiayiensis]RXT56328.1 abortive infection protein [Lacticaseibacillus chiayiensis]
MQLDAISELLHANNGQVTRRQIDQAGIDPHILGELTRAGKLERVDRGVYIDPAIFEDDMYILQYRFRKGIYFKDTALFLHDMTDRAPGTYEMNFPQNYHPTKINQYPVKVYRQNLAWYELGAELVKSPGQHLVRTYNVERTLCDILRTRDRSDAETIQQAMVSFSRMKNKNLHRLSEYADIFNVKDQIRTYMEVLL